MKPLIPMRKLSRACELSVMLLGLLVVNLRGDGPADNQVLSVRRIPPPGIPVPIAVRQELENKLLALNHRIETLRSDSQKNERAISLLPDIEIFYKAVDWALRYDQFYKEDEFDGARQLIEEGQKRADQLSQGSPEWIHQTGLVVRAYHSDLDDSIQPYGMVIPSGFVPGGPSLRLDFWFHGRGETLSELQFLLQRMHQAGQFVPQNALVMHLYGRYCNANKFAGEVDLFEALDHARGYYPIDDERMIVRGFSMGGAACWQFAAHYPGHWAAAAPGAGFAETPEFLKLFQGEVLHPTSWERKLWHLYDCTDYAMNFFNLPVIAYSGEVDKQKQAADIMEQAMAAENIQLTHIIGKGMGHRYDAASIEEIERRLTPIARRGKDPFPARVRFTTYTLRYNQSHWITVDHLENHWEQAVIEARFIPSEPGFSIQTRNISAFSINVPSGQWTSDVSARPMITINDQTLQGPLPFSDRSYTAHFSRVFGKWIPGKSAVSSSLKKSHGLQGPVDDAFMDRFLIVKPTGEAMHPSTEAWVESELLHAQDHWRLQFRGIPRTARDTQLTPEQIAKHNLILFGDPQSNSVIKQILDHLPLRWDSRSLVVDNREVSSEDHMPVLIFPNPLNPEKYVVLNSGFTYREYDYLNNARQIPKLPDYAILNIEFPVNAKVPGKVVHAGFFTDAWAYPSP